MKGVISMTDSGSPIYLDGIQEKLATERGVHIPHHDLADARAEAVFEPFGLSKHVRVRR